MIKLLFLFNLLFAQEQFVCTIKETGDLPKIRFRGQTREEAMERAVRLCMSLRTQRYVGVRLKSPSTERLIVFMEDCVNSTYCTELTNE